MGGSGRRQRRRTTSERLRPPAPVARVRETAGGGDEAPAERHLSRPASLVQREAPYLRAELYRIAGVSSACLLLVAVLVVVDRLR